MIAFVRTAAVAVLAVVFLYLLYEIRHALLNIYVAIVLAVLFDPFVRTVRRVRIRGYRPGRGAATAVVAFVTVSVAFLVGLIIVPPVASNATQLEMQWPELSARVFDWVHRTLPFSQSLNAESLRTWIHEIGLGSTVLSLGATVMDILSTLLLALYFLVDGPTAFTWGLTLVPAGGRQKLGAALRAGAHRMQGWVGGQALLMLAHGGSALVAFWLIGLRYVPALALFAAVINIIPVLGPIFTLVFAGLIAAITSPGKVLGVVIFYLAYHNTESIYLAPRIMSSAVGIPGVAIVAALLIGNQIAGFIGMAFAVPTAVLLAEIKRHYRP